MESEDLGKLFPELKEGVACRKEEVTLLEDSFINYKV